MKFDMILSGAGAQYVDNFTFIINGDEFEGKTSSTAAPFTYTFNNVSIDKSGKAQFKIDIKDPAYAITGGTAIEFVTSGL
jgi:hypothetical protein